MNKKNYFVLVISIFLIATICGCDNFKTYNSIENQGNSQIYTNNLSNYEKEDLSEDEIQALSLTLNDEFKAEATYQKVIDKFGEIRPFTNIINAEQKHSDALISIFEKYNLTIPDNDWYNKVKEQDSIKDACKEGVNAEIENIDLYDNLLSKIDNQDIIFIFESLRDASKYNHLPAFQRCSS
jgi:hypothetical protein